MPEGSETAVTLSRGGTLTPRQSELSTWLSCRRKAHWRYQDGWTQYETGSNIRDVGTYVHGLLAEYYDLTHESPDLRGHTFSPADVELGDKMFRTYEPEVEARGLDRNVGVVSVEQRLFSSEFPGVDGPVTVSGKLDLVYHDLEYDCFVGLDHKTSQAFFDTADNDFQLLTYAVILADNGIDVEFMEHNIVKRNQRTPAAKGYQVQRNRIPVAEKLERFRPQLAQLIWEWSSGLDTSAEDPINFAIGQKSCVWANGGCEFAVPCAMLDDGDDYQAVLEAEFHIEENPRDPQ